jgi:hypothetical protein
MNCKEINRVLTEGSMASPPQPEVENHLRTCANCRELVRAVTGPPAEPIAVQRPSAVSLRRIEEAIRADLRPVRPIAAKGWLFVTLILVFLAMVAVEVSRLGAFALRVMTPLQTSVILGALAVSTGLVAFSLVNQIVPGSRHRISPTLLPLGIIIALMIAALALFHVRPQQHFWERSWGCIRTGMPIAALTAIPCWLILRCGAMLYPPIAGAATGLLAGLAGATALQIHCPNLDVWHIVVGHVGVAAIGALTGLLIGTAAERALPVTSPSAAANKPSRRKI